MTKTTETKRTFTLASGAEVYRCYSTSLARLHTIPDHADYLSDVEVKAISKMAGELRRDSRQAAVYDEDLCLVVFARGCGPTQSRIAE